MRLAKLSLLCALGSLALTATAVARDVRPAPPQEEGTLSIREGRAGIQLRMSGSVIGRLAKGSIVLAVSPADTPMVVVRGHERRRPTGARRTLYSGSGIRFRIAAEKRFVVKIQGKGINFSAVGLGDGWIDGYGDPEQGIFYDGTYALNGEEFPTLPNERTWFELAAPPAD